MNDFNTPEKREFAIALGRASKAALENPAIAHATNAVSRAAIERLFQTEPHEHKRRDDEYHLVRAIQEVVNQLKEFATVGDALEREAYGDVDEDDNT